MIDALERYRRNRIKYFDGFLKSHKNYVKRIEVMLKKRSSVRPNSAIKKLKEISI
jgi:hypothetical protein